MTIMLLLFFCFHQAEIKVNLAGLKQDCEIFKSKIVNSPARFKGVSSNEANWSEISKMVLTAASKNIFQLNY